MLEPEAPGLGIVPTSCRHGALRSATENGSPGVPRIGRFVESLLDSKIAHRSRETQMQRNLLIHVEQKVAHKFTARFMERGPTCPPKLNE